MNTVLTSYGNVLYQPMVLIYRNEQSGEFFWTLKPFVIQHPIDLVALYSRNASI